MENKKPTPKKKTGGKWKIIVGALVVVVVVATVVLGAQGGLFKGDIFKLERVEEEFKTENDREKEKKEAKIEEIIKIEADYEKKEAKIEEIIEVEIDEETADEESPPPPPPPPPPDTYEIIRAEYAQMLVRALNIDTSAYNYSCANDVPANVWYTEAICYLMDNNIADVFVNTGEFGITKNIPRAEGARWLYLTFNVQQGWPFPGSLYQDVDTADWYGEYVNVLGAYGIFQVNAGDSFRPAEVLLRGEADYWTIQAEAVL